jgi:hypothetical protein
MTFQMAFVSQNLTNSFGYTKYLNLNLNLNLVSYDVPELNLVFQWCLMFDTKLKTSLPVIWLEILTWKFRVFHEQQLILVPVLRERQYRLIWLKSKFRVLRRLDFSSTFVSRLLAFSVRFSARSIDRDSLVYIEYRIEPRISTCLLNMNLNKGRD